MIFSGRAFLVRKYTLGILTITLVPHLYSVLS